MNRTTTQKENSKTTKNNVVKLDELTNKIQTKDSFLNNDKLQFQKSIFGPSEVPKMENEDGGFYLGESKVSKRQVTKCKMKGLGTHETGRCCSDFDFSQDSSFATTLRRKNKQKNRNQNSNDQFHEFQDRFILHNDRFILHFVRFQLLLV